MEEVDYLIPETIHEAPEEAFEEEVEVIPEKVPLKSANKLTEKVTCEGCGKSLSLHTYTYSHRCQARAPDEPGKEVKEVKENVNTGKLREALKEVKPSLTEKQSIKP